MDIVKFRNGKYGIRKRSLWDKIFGNEGVFRDFNRIIIRWRKFDDSYFYDCQLDTLVEVTKFYDDMKFGVIEKVIIVNDNESNDEIM